ncbi:MAG: recombinase family protein [Planctomycetia bacterium]|nr:recombinase family protein [Planctomycetia bacterium]
MTRRIVIYTRYSTDLQNPLSCEDQEREVRRALDRLGIDHSQAMVIHDHAHSGTDVHRDKFVQLQAMVYAKEVALLLVDDQSRLTRAGNALDFIKDLVFEGGRFISTAEGIDTTQPGWEMRVKVVEMKNSMVIDSLGPLVRRGQTGRLLRNLTAGDYPYGYESFYVYPEQAQRTGRGPKPEKDVRIKESESCWIIKMALWFILGWSYSRIAAELEKRGAPRNRRAKNRPWSDTSVRNILNNEKYGTGKWIRNKTTTIRDSGRKLKKKRARQTAVPEADWARAERPDLRILDAETWEKVQARFRELGDIYGKKDWQKKRGPKVHHSVAFPNSLLGGLLFCKCGARMHYKSSSSKAYYACPRAGQGACDMRTGVKFEQTEACLLELLAGICTGTPAWLQHAAQVARRKAEELAHAVPEAVAKDERRLDQVRSQSENLAREFAAGNSTDAIRKLAVQLEGEEGELKSRIDHARRLLNSVVEVPNDGWLGEQLTELSTMLKEDLSRTAILLRRILGRVTVDSVVAPGKSRGFARLHFQIDGAAVLKALTAARIPEASWSHLQIQTGQGAESEV